MWVIQKASLEPCWKATLTEADIVIDPDMSWRKKIHWMSSVINTVSWAALYNHFANGRSESDVDLKNPPQNCSPIRLKIIRWWGLLYSQEGSLDYCRGGGQNKSAVGLLFHKLQGDWRGLLGKAESLPWYAQAQWENKQTNKQTTILIVNRTVQLLHFIHWPSLKLQLLCLLAEM